MPPGITVVFRKNGSVHFENLENHPTVNVFQPSLKIKTLKTIDVIKFPCFSDLDTAPSISINKSPCFVDQPMIETYSILKKERGLEFEFVMLEHIEIKLGDGILNA